MTLRLILIRHAKSDWDDPMLEDHERPLNARGKRDAPRIGAWLKAEGFLPNAALVSSATRARETWAGVSQGLGDAAETEIVDGLYHASSDAILSYVRWMSAPTCALVAHNPGIGMFANRVVADAPKHARFEDYPTAATLVAEFEVAAWRDADRGGATCRAFVTPHDL